MCGIVGFVGSEKERMLIKQLDLIEHRGRDDRATYTRGRVHMGMNRLAIIDLRKSLYPIRYKHYVLLYNGEIYNHELLRIELGKKGIYPPRGCDAYVILPLYDLLGTPAFARLEGMFAISIYDTKKQEVILVRDKSGEKPLYYTKTANKFAFSSEIKALFPFISRPNVQQKSVGQYLAKGYVYGKETLLSEVNKVLASECVVYHISTTALRTLSYWKPQILIGKTKKNDVSERVQKLQALLEAAVVSRMLSDVPVGCFISGGIDSSLLAYYASRVAPMLRTYSITFPGYVRNDESFFIRYVARSLNTVHTEVRCTAKSVRPLFENLGKFIDEPIADPAILPTLLLSQEARKSVKVVLTGEGADEVFAGYPRYVRQKGIEFVRKNSMIFGPLLMFARIFAPHHFTQASQPLEQRYAAQRIWSEQERFMLNPNWNTPESQIYFSARQFPDPLARMQISDYRGYLSEQLFMKADKSTMAYNLESRAPYVDASLMNFAFNLPSDYKIKWLQGKYLLKKAALAYFPPWFVWRPKHGFSVPLRDWFCDELKDVALLSVEDVRTLAPSVNVNYYKTVVEDHVSRRQDNADKIWSVVVLCSWLSKHALTV